MKILKQQQLRWEMLKLQQSEVRDLEILANLEEGGNDHQEKGENHQEWDRYEQDHQEWED